MFGIPNPSIVGGALAIGILIGGTSAWKVESWRWGAADAARLVVEAKQRIADEKKLSDLSTAYETAKGKRDVVTRTITKNVDRIVERVAYRNVCLDADGLSALNAAIAGQGIGPSGPASPVRGGGESGGRNGSGGAPKGG